MMNSKRLYVAHFIMFLIPSTRCFAFKCALLRWCGAELGRNVRIVSSARFYISGKLSIGDGTWIGHDVLIIGGAADVRIGANVDIAPKVTLVTGTHEPFTTSGRAAGRAYSSPITIEDGVWLGACVTVLGGVEIGSCAIVAAGALVNKDVPSKVVVAGVPARLLRKTYQ